MSSFGKKCLEKTEGKEIKKETRKKAKKKEMEIEKEENTWRERCITPERLNIKGGILQKFVLQHTHRAMESRNG